MKFGKIFVLGTILTAFAPVALANTIYGELITNGVGTNGGAAVNALNLSFNLHPSPGQVQTTGTSSFAIFTAGSSVSYMPTASANNFVFANASVGSPFLLMNATSGGITLSVYVISVFDIVAGKNNGKGSFDALGYVMETGSLDKTPVSLAWLSTTNGATKVPFTLDITSLAVPPAIAPEPASLTLLGTGMLSVSGMIFRKRRKA